MMKMFLQVTISRMIPFLLIVSVCIAACHTYSPRSNADPRPSICYTYGVNQRRSGYVDINGPSSVLLLRRTQYGPLLAPQGDITAGASVSSLDGTIYIQSVRTGIQAYTAGGSRKWTLSDAKGTSTPLILPSGDIIAVAKSGYIYCISPTGRVTWKLKLDDQLTSSPVYHSDNIFVASCSGTVYCIDISGREVWNVDLISVIIAPLTLQGETLICLTRKGRVHLLDISGNRIAQIKVNGKCIYAAAASSDYFCVVDTSSHLYAISYDASLLWEKKFIDNEISPPSISNSGKLYIGGVNGLYILDNNGNIIHHHEFEGGVCAKPIVDSSNKVYLSIGDFERGYTMCLDDSGVELWRVEEKCSPQQMLIDRENRVVYTTRRNQLIMLEGT